jgi:Flp pilus assembly protein CpaB
MVGRHRVKGGAALLLVAIWVTVRAASPDPPLLVGVVVVAHDLPAGHLLTAEDLKTAKWPANLTPAGRLASGTEVNYAGAQQPGSASFIGRILAGGIRQGEPLTDARVLGPGLLRGLPAGSVAVPVRLTDPTGAVLVQPGDHVDILASTAATWSAEDAGSSSFSPATTARAARNALVLSVPGATGSMTNAAGQGGSGLAGSGGQGTGGPGAADDGAMAGLLVLAVQASEVDRLAGATAGAQVSVTVLP